MQVVRDLKNSLNKPCAICMGNFDGMHRGHQMMIDATVNYAKQHNLVSTVILFEPHPKEFFQQQNAPARLMLLSDKIARLQQWGVDQVICLRFNKQLASTSADHFVNAVLLQQLHMQAIIISEGARFGHKQMGDITLLQKLSKQHGFVIIQPEKLLHAAERVSSTKIRDLLMLGDCEKVAELLGHPYQMTGRIIYGNQLGRTLGFPTINIACQRKTVALSGIFAVDVQLEFYPQTFQGVAHIARRSIVNDTKPILEVNIFDFNEDVYGQRATISFLHKIRDTKAVSDLDELKQLIQHDADDVKQYFHVE